MTLKRRSIAEIFAVPHSFNPNLTLVEALVAVAIAFSRIFLGSLLFAVCGVGGWLTYAAIGNPWLRGLALLPIVLLFLATLALLMIGISSLANRILRKPAT
jgi:hypothetical protein